MAGWFKKLFSKKDTSLYHVTYEKSDATRLFDDLEDLAIKKQKLQQYLTRLEKKQDDLSIYEKLDEDETGKLVMWVNQYREIVEQKQLLKGRLIKNNRALAILSQYEEELPELMKEVAETESKVKENERDLIYLEEEKEDILEEREVLLKGYQFLKIFSVIMVFVMSAFVIGGFAMLQLLREGIWVYLSIVSIALVFFLAGILYSKSYLERALRQNELLQKKVVRYINKTKIRYFHNKRYLTFNYEKLGVDSSAKLEMYYNRYMKNRDNEKQYGDLNRRLMHIEAEMIDLFEKYDMVFDEMDALEEWVAAPKKATAMKKVVEEKEKIEMQMKGFEAFEEELWKEVYGLKEEAKYKEVIEKRLQQYLILTKDHLDKDTQNN